MPSEPAATDRKGLEFESFFNSGDRHIADITWVSHDVGIPGSGFSMTGVMAPDFWDRDSVTIVASKYFYGKTEAISPTTGFRALPDEGGREYSVGHPIGRIANTIANAGLNRGYYDADNCAIFRDELKAIMLHQIAAFNSPVWFNVGNGHEYGIRGDSSGYYWDFDEATTKRIPAGDAYMHPQGSACLPYAARVNTDRGLLPIGDVIQMVNRGAIVNTFDRNGNPTRIVAGVCNGNKRLRTVCLADGSRLRLTGNHVVFVRGTDGEISEKTVAELNKGDRLVLSRSILMGAVTAQSDSLSPDSEMAWISGVMVGNGYSGRPESATSDIWELKVNTESERDRATAILSSYNLPFAVKQFHWGYTIRGYGEAGKAFWDRVGLWDKTNSKEVPEWVLRGGADLALPFLRGLFDTDGCVTPASNDRVCVTFSNTSKQVATWAQILLRSVGVYAQISEYVDQRDNYARKPIFTVAIRDQQSVGVFAERIGFTNTNKASVLESRRSRSDRDYRQDIVEVTAVKSAGLERVYDIQTESGEFWYEGVLVHNCFILGLKDDMEAILDAVKAEGTLFKFGSGIGESLSPLRSKRERLTGGGRPSGPMSFLKLYDTTASIVKSGGKTRRAARLNNLNTRHPDILEFIKAKGIEQDKANALLAAGFSKGMDGEAATTVAYQSTNISIWASDAFMAAAEHSEMWQTYAVTTGTEWNTMGEAMPAYNASELMDEAAKSCWKCGDPGIQFADTINRYNVVANTAPINTSNPCIRRGMRLMTDKGWRKVEDIVGGEKGEVVANLFDGVGFVTGSVWKTGSKAVVRLHLNSGETLDLTPDHRVKTVDGWVEANDCEGKALPRVFPTHDTGSDELPSVVQGRRDRYIVASPRLMETLGFLQGDSTIRDKIGVTIVWYTPEKDSAFIDETVLPILTDIAARNDEDDFKATPLADGRHGYTISRKKLTNWLLALGFHADSLPNRMLPDCVWSLTRGSQAAFLRGLYGANGNVLVDARKAVNLVSSCRAMLAEVQLLLRSLGIHATIRVHNKEQDVAWPNGTYTSKESYRLEITTQHDIAEFSRVVGFPQKTQADRLASIVPAVGSFAGNRAINRDTAVVNRVEDLGEVDDVYDFRAPTTSSGLANGVIVHNCGEYLFIDDSACNLASINLLWFLLPNNTFDVDAFRRTVRTMIVAMDILVDLAGYPTEKICRNSHRFRPLGLGFANLGGLLMAMGLPYDSDEGRAIAGFISAIEQVTAVEISAELAEAMGPFDGLNDARLDTSDDAVEVLDNWEPMLRVMGLHRESAMAAAVDVDGVLSNPVFDFEPTTWIKGYWDQVWEKVSKHGLRNAQTTLIAPTGTIAFAMGCDTTGLEPEIALVRHKSLAGGGVLNMANRLVGRALESLEYPIHVITQIEEYVAANGTIEGCPLVAEKHLPVFDCALPTKAGGRVLSWRAHVDMLAAIQPHLSGSASKTINCPADFTPADIRDVYFYAHKAGCKSITVYRDGSKEDQPVKTEKPKAAPDPVSALDVATAENRAKLAYGINPMGVVSSPIVGTPAPTPATPRGVEPIRRKLPRDRASRTHHFDVAQHEGYITVGMYDDGKPAELFITMAKQGSTISGLMDTIGILVSFLLQYGVPIDALCRKLTGSRFEPAGMTRTPEVPMATSVVDYIFRWLGCKFAPGGVAQYGVVRDTNSDDEPIHPADREVRSDAPMCEVCGAMMVATGRCFTCRACGNNNGGCQ